MFVSESVHDFCIIYSRGINRKDAQHNRYHFRSSIDLESGESPEMYFYPDLNLNASEIPEVNEHWTVLC
jgi:hypothetical protein